MKRTPIVAAVVLVSVLSVLAGCKRDNRDQLPPPGNTRIYCETCGAWMESNAPHGIFLGESGKQEGDSEADGEEDKDADFTVKHMECALKSGKMGVMVSFLKPGDKMYNRLDPAKQVKVATEKK